MTKYRRIPLNPIIPEESAIIVIYAFYSKPNEPGGWASLIRYKDKEEILSGSEFPTTITHLHLTAIMNAIEHLSLVEDLPLFVQFDIYIPFDSLPQNLYQLTTSKKSKKTTVAKGENQLWEFLLIADVEYNLIWHKLKELKNNADVKLVSELAVLKFEQADRRLQRESRKKENQLHKEGSLIYDLHQKEEPATAHGRNIPFGGTTTGRKKRG